MNQLTAFTLAKFVCTPAMEILFLAGVILLLVYLGLHVDGVIRRQDKHECDFRDRCKADDERFRSLGIELRSLDDAVVAVERWTEDRVTAAAQGAMKESARLLAIVHGHSVSLKDRAGDVSKLREDVRRLIDRLLRIETTLEQGHAAADRMGSDMHQLARTLGDVAHSVNTAAGSCHAIGKRFQGDDGDEAEAEDAFDDFAVS